MANYILKQTSSLKLLVGARHYSGRKPRREFLDDMQRPPDEPLR
jgi:hypothetical protein